MPLGRPSQTGEPTWELASLFPNQGSWTELEYLELDRRHKRLYELVHGNLEILAMPSLSHQEIAFFLAKQLDAYVRERKIGKVVMAPCPVRLDVKHYREPDVFIRTDRPIRDGQPEGADLVMEVVSPGERERKRDLETKPVVYAEAGIPEYWIIDPLEQRITVLALEGAEFRTAGVYAPGETAR
ncbi:MAG TPA: Uma2 family endonuclease, partial [Pirellulaceae bacterium]|nr:Uma2 family endonuclease [Pirellulaceae bacterium]